MKPRPNLCIELRVQEWIASYKHVFRLDRMSADTLARLPIIILAKARKGIQVYVDRTLKLRGTPSRSKATVNIFTNIILANYIDKIPRTSSRSLDLFLVRLE